MVKEKTQLGAIGAGLADLNEMRLSKFEYALLTAKLMEVSGPWAGKTLRGGLGMPVSVFCV